ncbi:MAG: PIN domain-containing protein [Actinomycetota bacterium]|jgi:predicted nucleic acid-binding protein|nr:PIN domain-containing protein [Rubrobacter sp.]MDQ3509059.1 PIN domain-containing protein [Actinomycetota bacterium]
MASSLDTNVLLYFVDDAETEKQARAKEVVEREMTAGTMLVSTQVLQEFYNNATRKLQMPLSSEAAERSVRRFIEISIVIQIDTEIILAAIARTRTMSISFWDALIVEAALKGGAEKLITEDLNHGQTVDGLRIENPFI